ncbi:MAG: efflux RND transporter periplasmic adaptor subunit, partial [Jaaginema sp. PMC 1079.18]|nr:efflux RND transporter periplasmic adaptor subunit [Jaaginema sp. PMC 1080.18]MEC4853848.1 efflux RND transporter periplasmic adaptor subunit [Jaaginema sp. PMC 1079.18]MEC4868774.1 efflux RND transporter periplasmic adaptor subunit [Jaaginema sp. PMC 1078.18]
QQPTTNNQQPTTNNQQPKYLNLKMIKTLLLLGFLFLPINACQNTNSEAENAQNQRAERGKNVDVAIAKTGFLNAAKEYVGTTKPSVEVALRSQVEGKLLNLTVDVGDRVVKNQLLARLDDTLLVTEVNKAQADLAALESEQAQAQAEVSEAQAQLERSRVELQQAEANAKRYQDLVKEGAVTAQQAETFQTQARVAQQGVLSAQDQLRSRQKAVESIIGRIAAQRAVINDRITRKTYANLYSPINGVVLAKISEPGNLVTAGGEVLQLGNLASVKVIIPVSELDLETLQIGQSVSVRLDAFPDQTFTGKIARIAPVADPVSRQIPVEVTLPNPNSDITSNLLARVSFQQGASPRVVVPESALNNREDQQATIFVVSDSTESEAVVSAKTVTIGEIMNGQAAILAGLQAGDRFVVNSSQPLEEGDRVRLSILSES